MGRREARIERKLQKELDHRVKSARLIESVKADLVPRTEVQVDTSGTPRAGENPNSIMQMRMDFRMLDCADRVGRWSWGQERNWCSPEHNAGNACDTRSLMIEMSGLFWHEICAQTTGNKDRHFKHHAQLLDSICSEAKDRWVEIGRLEDTLFRFRSGGKERLWGFRAGHVFYVVWLDRHHKIYPVD